jgi:hypothetical protein
MKVKFSQERTLKAGKFHDPNALYLKMFDKKDKEEAEKKRQEQALAGAEAKPEAAFPSIAGNVGVTG